MVRAVFIDRDGVICKEKNLFYGGKEILVPEDFEWEINAQAGLSRIPLEYKIVIVTNQSAINRGLLKVEDFHGINQLIEEELARNGRRVDGVYFCPHTPEQTCECRKPKIGMLLLARKDLGIDLSSSYVIGDKTSDMKMGKDAGCKTILVKTGYGGRDNTYDVKADIEVENLYEAVKNLK